MTRDLKPCWKCESSNIIDYGETLRAIECAYCGEKAASLEKWNKFYKTVHGDRKRIEWLEDRLYSQVQEIGKIQWENLTEQLQGSISNPPHPVSALGSVSIINIPLTADKKETPKQDDKSNKSGYHYCAMVANPKSVIDIIKEVETITPKTELNFKILYANDLYILCEVKKNVPINGVSSTYPIIVDLAVKDAILLRCRDYFSCTPEQFQEALKEFKKRK